MANEYKSITEGALLVLTIVFWNYFLDWLGYRFSILQRLVRPPPLKLTQDGRMLLRNMRQEMITVEELESQLRQQGIETCEQVREVYIEGDGRISVINQDRTQSKPREKVPH